MMDKKGQSALEYLMTYGWALVVIVIVIAALFAFGIFNPPTGGTCTGLDKLLYKDHTASADGNFSIAVQNGAGGTISAISIQFTDDAGNVSWTALNGGSLGSADTNTFSSDGTGNFAIGNYVVTAGITYTSPAGLVKTETATCTGLITS